jgi:hypothetical protein
MDEVSCCSGINQEASQNRDGSSPQNDAVVDEADAYCAPSIRSLVRDERVLAKPPAPVGSQTAVGRAGDRVFVDPGSGREESGNKIIGRRIGPASNDGTPHVKGFQQAEVLLNLLPRGTNTVKDERPVTQKGSCQSAFFGVGVKEWAVANARSVVVVSGSAQDHPH